MRRRMEIAAVLAAEERKSSSKEKKRRRRATKEGKLTDQKEVTARELKRMRGLCSRLLLQLLDLLFGYPLAHSSPPPRRYCRPASALFSEVAVVVFASEAVLERMKKLQRQQVQQK